MLIVGLWNQDRLEIPASWLTICLILGKILNFTIFHFFLWNNIFPHQRIWWRINILQKVLPYLAQAFIPFVPCYYFLFFSLEINTIWHSMLVLLFCFFCLHVYFLCLPTELYESRTFVGIIYHWGQNNLVHILGDQYIFGKGMKE